MCDTRDAGTTTHTRSTAPIHPPIRSHRGGVAETRAHRGDAGWTRRDVARARWRRWVEGWKYHARDTARASVVDAPRARGGVETMVWLDACAIILGGAPARARFENLWRAV